MTRAQKERIAVIGAGLMGHGIAQVFAVAGHSVKVYDKSEETLKTLRERIEKNLYDLGCQLDGLARVTGHSDLGEAVSDADVVFEAAPEILDLKRSLFSDLERLTPAEALLASNSSVIPISWIAAGLESSRRMLATHWWNPPFLVPLVEVVGSPDASESAIRSMQELLASVGKTPALIKKDVPGFVGNRLQHALWREAIALVAEGICDAETVDTVVKASFGRRLAVLGPLENADLVGTDLTLDIHRVILPEIDRTPGPLPLLEQMVSEGRLGMKSGQGFRKWSQADAQALRACVLKHLEWLNEREASKTQTAESLVRSTVDR